MATIEELENEIRQLKDKFGSKIYELERELQYLKNTERENSAIIDEILTRLPKKKQNHRLD